MATQTSEAVRVRLPVLQHEKSYQHWRKAILMWSLVTDVEPEKQGLVVALNLSGRERELALNIDSAELNKKTGLTTLLNLLEEEIQGLVTYRTFQTLDNLRKCPLQFMHAYVNSFKTFYESAETLGSSIPDKILAYMLLNGSGLSQERQEKILKTTEVISVARISAALLSAGDRPWTKAFPKTTASGSKQLQPICTQPNQSPQWRTQGSSLSNFSSKFTVSASNGQTSVAGAYSTNGKQEAKSSSNPFSSINNNLKKKNDDPSATDNTKPLPATGPLKVDKKPGQWNCVDCYTENEPIDAVCPCCGKTNPNDPAAPKEMPIATGAKARAQKTSTPTATPIVPSFGFATTSIEASAPQAVHLQRIDSTTEGMLVANKNAGSWNCPACYSPNFATDLQCPCCYTPNPNAPKTDTGDSKVKLPGSQTSPKFCFGTPSGQKPSTTFSFGIPQSGSSNASPSSTNPTKPFLTASPLTATEARAKATSTPTATPIVLTFDAATTPAKASAPQAVQFQAIGATTGGILVTKKGAGSWNCPACYSPNLETNLQCPCCSTPNPNAPKTDAGDRAANTNNTSEQQQTSNLFSNLLSNLSNTTTQLTSDSTKPRFPSVGEEENSDDADDDDDNDDDSEYKSSKDSSCKEEEDFAQKKERYWSPLNRAQQEQKKNNDDNDVICLGQILPSEELQKKAESLMLPKHFYNFVKDGDERMDDASEREKDQARKSGYDEKIEDEKKDKILKFIEDRDSGKLKLNQKTTTATTTKSSRFGNTTKTSTAKLADFSSTEESWVFDGATPSSPTFSNVVAASFTSLSSRVQNVKFTKDPSVCFSTIVYSASGVLRLRLCLRLAFCVCVLAIFFNTLHIFEE